MRKGFLIKFLKWFSARRERRAKRLAEKLERIQKSVFRLNETIAVWDDSQNINFVLMPTHNDQTPSRSDVIKMLKNQDYRDLSLPAVVERIYDAPPIKKGAKGGLRNPTGRPLALNEKKIEDLKLYWSQGMSKAEIGRRLGVTATTVTKYVRQMSVN